MFFCFFCFCYFVILFFVIADHRSGVAKAIFKIFSVYIYEYAGQVVGQLKVIYGRYTRKSWIRLVGIFDWSKFCIVCFMIP